MIPIFISGPHGCGKSSLIKDLVSENESYIKDDYSIDFVNDLPTVSKMTIYEKCLLRLYHRFYTAEQALMKCKTENNKEILIIDRSIYDSVVYNNVEMQLHNFTEKQYENLNEISKCALELLDPYVIILNPSENEVTEYLRMRTESGTRKKEINFVQEKIHQIIFI